MRNYKLLSVLILTVLIVVLTLQNQTPVQIAILYWRFEIPLVAQWLVALFLGIFIGYALNIRKKDKTETNNMQNEDVEYTKMD